MFSVALELSKQEADTWKLLELIHESNLLFDYKEEQTKSTCYPISLSNREIIDGLDNFDYLKKNRLILKWLESCHIERVENYPEKIRDPLKSTLKSLRQNQSKRSDNEVTSVDPDAQILLNGMDMLDLIGEDKVDQENIWKHIYQLMRSGQYIEAREFAMKQHYYWVAASLSGMDHGDVIQETLPTKNYHHHRGAASVYMKQGNTRRSTWIQTCGIYSSLLDDHTSPSGGDGSNTVCHLEKAIYATVSNNIKVLMTSPVVHTWSDQLWVLMKALYEYQIQDTLHTQHKLKAQDSKFYPGCNNLDLVKESDYLKKLRASLQTFIRPSSSFQLISPIHDYHFIMESCPVPNVKYDNITIEGDNKRKKKDDNNISYAEALILKLQAAIIIGGSGLLIYIKTTLLDVLNDLHNFPYKGEILRVYSKLILWLRYNAHHSTAQSYVTDALLTQVLEAEMDYNRIYTTTWTLPTYMTSLSHSRQLTKCMQLYEKYVHLYTSSSPHSSTLLLLGGSSDMMNRMNDSSHLTPAIHDSLYDIFHLYSHSISDHVELILSITLYGMDSLNTLSSITSWSRITTDTDTNTSPLTTTSMKVVTVDDENNKLNRMKATILFFLTHENYKLYAYSLFSSYCLQLVINEYGTMSTAAVAATAESSTQGQGWQKKTSSSSVHTNDAVSIIEELLIICHVQKDMTSPHHDNDSSTTTIMENWMNVSVWKQYTHIIQLYRHLLQSIQYFDASTRSVYLGNRQNYERLVTQDFHRLNTEAEVTYNSILKFLLGYSHEDVLIGSPEEGSGSDETIIGVLQIYRHQEKDMLDQVQECIQYIHTAVLKIHSQVSNESVSIPSVTLPSSYQSSSQSLSVENTIAFIDQLMHLMTELSVDKDIDIDSSCLDQGKTLLSTLVKMPLTIQLSDQLIPLELQLVRLNRLLITIEQSRKGCRVLLAQSLVKLIQICKDFISYSRNINENTHKKWLHKVYDLVKMLADENVNMRLYSLLNWDDLQHYVGEINMILIQQDKPSMI